jgi:putative Holliday junction resolvase
MQNDIVTVIGLDIGAARTGVAVANQHAMISQPLTTLTNIDTVPEDIAKLAKDHKAVALVIGVPRNLNGDNTDQTKYVEEIADQIRDVVDLPMHFIDEALTSVKAKTELELRHKPYTKEEIDMLSAAYILEDFLKLHPEVFKNG